MTTGDLDALRALKDVLRGLVLAEATLPEPPSGAGVDLAGVVPGEMLVGGV